MNNNIILYKMQIFWNILVLAYLSCYVKLSKQFENAMKWINCLNVVIWLYAIIFGWMNYSIVYNDFFLKSPDHKKFENVYFVLWLMLWIRLSPLVVGCCCCCCTCTVGVAYYLEPEFVTDLYMIIIDAEP